MRKNQCKFCLSRSCYTRIVTRDMKFDEICCGRHVRQLEIYADNELNGALRMHISSTRKLFRGEAYPTGDDYILKTGGG